MPDDTTVTTVLAVWGAVLSSALGVLKIRDGWLDRPRLRIVLRPGRKSGVYPSPYGEAFLLIINVANVGRRPTSINQVSLLLPKGSGKRFVGFFLDALTFTYPVELQENRDHDFAANEDSIRTGYKLTPDRYVVRVDTAGGRVYWSHGPLTRRWKSRRWKL